MADTPQNKIRLGPVAQLGFVVEDAEAIALRWTTLFDLPPPRIVEWPLRPGMTAELRGQPIDLKMKIAFVETEALQLEFIQPLSDDNLFREFLRERGGGLHHIMFNMPEPLAIAEQLGVSILQKGQSITPGLSWYYLDTEKELGMPLELRETPRQAPE